MKHHRSICLLLVASIAAIVAEPVYENTFCMQRRCPYEGYFRCKSNGTCIHTQYVCDGDNNCLDGSDEENCGPAYYGCRGFLCDNRTTCLPRRSVCDGTTSCSDGSDEADCLTGRCPFDSDVKCNDTGKCVESKFICNSDISCNYETDEENCESRPCPYDGDFRCGNGACIRPTDVCDRLVDCRDGSDEINCKSNICPYDGDVEFHYSHHLYAASFCYRSYEYCSPRMFEDYYYFFRRVLDVDNPNCSTIHCPYEGDYRCPLSGVCIRSYELCDGSNQCINGEDEQNCTSGIIHCPINKWFCGEVYGCYDASSFCFHNRIGNYHCAYNCSDSCGNSTHINPYIVICNGIIDCADGSDESDCYNRTCVADGDFRCESTGACIRQARVCDGYMHCSDGSDETNCTLWSCSIPGDVKCRDNGTCIHYDRICNGINDCMDGSDEEDCASKPCPYSGDKRCKTTQACIRADKWCNQEIDCTDGSDEECFDTPCRYASDFRCTYNGHCIRADEVCDGTEDCLDGSDEGMNYCPEVFTLGIHWERTLTKTINTHKCSEIYPSSLKLTDVITRECLRNKTWAPVNMSQCVMNSDSPVVMIAVVTLETNSTSLVKSRQDVIIEEMKLTEQPAVHMEIIQSVSNANVSVKITYEFNALNTTEPLKDINYDMNIITLGNFSVANVPNLTIFQSTDVCRCPDSVSSSTVPTGANNAESIVIISVCSGKPCQYSNSNFTYQCAAPFAGDGRMCGKDSDEDGYPDMALNCNDTHCIQDNCPTVYNPNQNLEACNGTQVNNSDQNLGGYNGTQGNNSDHNLEGCNGTQVNNIDQNLEGNNSTHQVNNTDQNPERCNCIQEHDDDEDGLSTSAAIGITFIITLIFSILSTLLIVFIVYKIIKSKQSTARNENSATCTIVTDTSFSRDSTTEYPENFNSAKDNARYQSNTGASIQMSPANSREKFESNNNAPAYKNLN